MNEIVETLNAWLTWFGDPGETPPPALVEEEAQIGVEPHGFNSNRFICRFETGNVVFDVGLLLNGKSGEEDAAAIVKLALIALHTPFDEPVEVRVSDGLADFNGGTLADFLNLIDRIGIAREQDKTVIFLP